MAFQRPTLKQIADRIESDVTSKLKIGKPLSRSFVKALAYAYAAACYLIYGFLDYISKQMIPDTADAENLDRWGFNVYGVARIEGSFAERDVTFTGSNGAVIPAGTTLRRSDGVEYVTETEVVISGGSATAHVICEEFGTNGNVDTGTTLQLVSPISSVNSEATVAATNAINGTERESDEAYLARVLNRIQEPPNGGSASDYLKWAKEVAGVTRAWVDPLRYGIGTVGLTFVLDGEADIIPGAPKVAEVQAYIDERRPVTANVTVYAPIEAAQDFTIQINPNTSDVQAAIEAELRDLFNRESEPEGTILISHVREAISIAAGEVDHILISPTANIEAGSGELKTLGVITWQPIP